MEPINKVIEQLSSPHGPCCIGCGVQLRIDLVPQYSQGCTACQQRMSDDFPRLAQLSSPSKPFRLPDNNFDEACARIVDLLQNDDPQAHKEARKFLERVRPGLCERLGVEQPAEPSACVIHLDDESSLRSPTAGADYWALYRGEVHIRYLDKFEKNFVNKALAAGRGGQARVNSHPSAVRVSPGNAEPLWLYGSTQATDRVQAMVTALHAVRAVPTRTEQRIWINSDGQTELLRYSDEDLKDFHSGVRFMMDRIAKIINTNTDILGRV
jgi:hypothetical protein